MEGYHGSGGGNRFFPNIKQFMTVYAAGSGDDQRAAHVFVDCEATEAVNSLKNELRAISSGNYNANSLDKIVGKGRLGKHGSYEGWAKAVLQWLAAYKRGA
jgi:hypothetical protein